jgi:hypothetical protein
MSISSWTMVMAVKKQSREETFLNGSGTCIASRGCTLSNLEIWSVEVIDYLLGMEVDMRMSDVTL